MRDALKLFHLILSVIITLLLLIGDFTPLLDGAMLTIGDLIITLLNGLDGASVTKTGGGWVLIGSILALISLVLLLILSIVACFLAWKSKVKPCVILYSITCILPIPAAVMELLGLYKGASENMLIEYPVIQIAPPIIALILVIPLIILSVANIFLMVRGDSDD